MQKIRLLLVVAALAVVLALGLWLGFMFHRFTSGGTTVYNTAAVVKQVQTLSQLVTVKYVIEKVVVYEDVKWFPGGENRVLMIAHGVVKAGVDFQKLKPEDLELSGKRVKIRLPNPQITDCYLDENRTQVVERSTGFQPYRPKHEAVPSAFQPVLKRCMDCYLELHALRIQQ